MALIIETGAGLPDSQSYVSVAELETYAASLLDDLPEGEAAKESLLLRAMQYLEQFVEKPRYKGTRNSADQALAWPRTGVYIDGFPLAKDRIPTALKRAQMQLAIEATNYDLMPSSDGYAVAKEQVDVIEVEYATGGRLSGASLPVQPNFPIVDSLLAGLLESAPTRIRSVRI